MTKPTPQERKDAQKGVKTLLHLRGFDWTTKSNAIHILDNHKVWTSLGAMTRKNRVAKSPIYVQRRLLIIYEAILKTHDKQPRLNVNSTAFMRAVHHEVSKTQHDIIDFISSKELGRIIEVYNFAGATIKAPKGQGPLSSIGSQLRRAVCEWLSVLRNLRVEKIKKIEDKEKKNKKPKVDNGQDTRSLVMLTGGPVVVSEFSPAQLDNESDKAYIERLKDKVRDLRTRRALQKDMIQEQDATIKQKETTIKEKDAMIHRQSVRIAELQQDDGEDYDHDDRHNNGGDGDGSGGAVEEESEDEYGVGNDAKTTSPVSPYRSQAEQRLRYNRKY